MVESRELRVGSRRFVAVAAPFIDTAPDTDTATVIGVGFCHCHCYGDCRCRCRGDQNPRLVQIYSLVVSVEPSKKAPYVVVFPPCRLGSS